MFIKQRLSNIRASNMSMLLRGSSQATFYAQNAKSFGGGTVRTAGANVGSGTVGSSNARYFSDYDHGVGTTSGHSATSGVVRTAAGGSANVAWSGFRGMGRLSMGGDMDTVNTNGTIPGYSSRVISNPSISHTIRRSGRAPAATQLTGTSSSSFKHSPMAFTSSTYSPSYSGFHYSHLGGRAAAGDLIFMTCVLGTNSGYSLGSNGPCRGTTYTSASFTGVTNVYSGGGTCSNSSASMITNQHTSSYADTSWWGAYFIAQGGEDVVRHRFWRSGYTGTYQLTAGIIHGPFTVPRMQYIASEGTNVSLQHQLGTLNGRGEHTILYSPNPFVCTTQIGSTDDSIIQGAANSPHISWSSGTYEESVDLTGKVTGTARYLRIKSPTNQGSNDNFKVSVGMT